MYMLSKRHYLVLQRARLVKNCQHPQDTGFWEGQTTVAAVRTGPRPGARACSHELRKQVKTTGIFLSSS